ncbi:hypothetical protein MKX01_001872 [Papaver californicum]|nr:hypothetical protein MKX01_001872 [Papaver californicum]
MEVVAVAVATTPAVIQVLPLRLFSDHRHPRSSIPHIFNKSTTTNSSSFVSKIEHNFVNNSMSQGFHQGIINFSNGFDRSTTLHRQDQQMDDQPSSSQRDINRFRVQGYEQPTVAAAPMGSLEEDQSSTSHHHHRHQLPVGYETGAGMLSEMFNFQSIPTTSTDMLEEQNQMSMNYRLLSRPSSSSAAAAMQLFQMNPQQRSPSPPPPPPQQQQQHQQHLHGFHHSTAAAAAEEVTFDGNPISVGQFMTWVPSNNDNVEVINSNSTAATSKIGGLSLSLSSLQHLEAAKQEEFRMGDGGFFYYNQQLENLGSHHHPPHQQQQHLQPLRLQGSGHGNQLSSSSQQQHHHQIHGGFSSPSTVGVVNVLRNSKYMKATQELLEEFCSVGSRGLHHLKNHKRLARRNSNPDTNQVGGSGGGGDNNIVGSSSSSKDVTPPLSAADRIEHQRKKVSLLSMLDEVDRRYNYYCEQMQMVVNTFDSVMGYGAATPYTTLAQKAMSGHFRCLKDEISTQLKQTSELLGDKERTTGSGVTKGETPRLRLLDQSLRQQRAFHQMGMMEQEAWRPQRGLPERSVTILRAWLFEHFLHPYPSDADKHLLARQTGLSRNQVSNWFINARVRLWKPMVEEMYQQESKEAEEMTTTTATTTGHDERENSRDEYHQFHRVRNSNQQKATTNTTPPSQPITTTQPTAATTTDATVIAAAAAGMRSEIDAIENDRSSSSSSLNAININCSSETTNNIYTTSSTFHNNDIPPSSIILSNNQQQQRMLGNDTGNRGCITLKNRLVTHEYGSTSSSVSNAHQDMESTLIRFGTASGDVSLTLGLRHAGNVPTENRFSVKDRF